MPPNCRGCGAKVHEGVDLCPSCRTERVPAALGADELFGQPVEAEPTNVMLTPYEMRPRFVGRQSALDRMMKAFDDARDLRELAFVAVIGPPGSGKTRIVKELARHVKQRSPQTRFLIGPAGTPADSSGAIHSSVVRVCRTSCSIGISVSRLRTRPALVAKRSSRAKWGQPAISQNFANCPSLPTARTRWPSFDLNTW